MPTRRVSNILLISFRMFKCLSNFHVKCECNKAVFKVKFKTPKHANKL